MFSDFHLLPSYQPLFRELGLDAAAVFSSPAIKIWRKLEDRENGLLDAEMNGQPVRLHVKRYPAWAQAEREVAGHKLLAAAGVPTAELVAWGRSFGRGFVIFADLAPFQQADQALQAGYPFEKILQSSAALAARLHSANLHHRDLYLGHFFLNESGEVKVIDVARVKHLPRWPFRRRWIVKDLAQFVYSMQQLNVPAAQQQQWLQTYAELAKVDAKPLRRPIARKVARIAAHDIRLNKSQPHRNMAAPKLERK